MARRPITRDFYDLLVQGFRETPGNFTHAAHVAGCARRTAYRAWHEGWAKTGLTWAIPIRLVIEQDRLEAHRLEVQSKQDELKQQHEKRAMQSELGTAAWTEVAKMLEFHRNAVSRTAATAVHLSAACFTLAPVVADRMKKLVDDPNVSVDKLLRVLGNATLLLERLSKAVAAHVQAEKLFHNEPSAMVKLDDITEVMPVDEGIARVEAARQALASIKEGHMRLIQGGLSARPDEQPPEPETDLDKAEGK